MNTRRVFIFCVFIFVYLVLCIYFCVFGFVYLVLFLCFI